MMYDWKGYPYPKKGWRYQKDTMQKLHDEGRLYYPVDSHGNPDYSKRIRLKRYLAEQEGSIITNIWSDIQSLTHHAKERTGYPTQKPLALMHRIIKASSNAGDMVLDPFCGCATTCVAAQQLGRRWIGIDIEKQASKILIERLSDDAGMFSQFVHRTDVPHRTDIVEVEISLTVKERLFHAQSGVCNGCGTAFEIRHFEVDHIIPRAKGGGNYYENYQLLCGSCNRIKGDRPMEYLMNRLNVIERAHRRVSFGD
jgi:site-specific DNA-methyltransferase (adenine-specific)